MGQGSLLSNSWDRVLIWLMFLTQVGVEPSQCLSEWVRIAQLVTAGAGVPRVDVSNPGGGRAQPKFV